FHEVPLAVADRIVAEAYRVLRPGGRFVVVDFPNFPKGVTSVYEDYHRDFDNKNNGEPYSSDFVYHNFEDTLRRAGFTIITGNATPDQWTPMRVAEK
ncbi:MAG: hypothetical protein NZ518_08435, partial [Dehalococcoidia bacterium]|nr:hypothetical protein [Dehalococcoidia bacterium]